MGCGASRTDVLKSVVSEANPNSTKTKSNNKKSIKPKESDNHNGEANGNNNSSTPNLDSLNSEGSTIPASEKYQNFNGTHNEHLKPLTLPPLKPPRTFKNMDSDGKDIEPGQNNPKATPIAFEVPAEEEDGSLIKKHPPRRLRRIIDPEQSPEPVLTQEILQEKVQQANERRNNVLTQRAASARQKSARAGTRVRRPMPESEILSEFANGGIESGTKEENELNSDIM